MTPATPSEPSEGAMEAARAIRARERNVVERWGKQSDATLTRNLAEDLDSFALRAAPDAGDAGREAVALCANCDHLPSSHHRGLFCYVGHGPGSHERCECERYRLQEGALKITDEQVRAAPDEKGEREAFEKWMRDFHGNDGALEIGPDGCYRFMEDGAEVDGTCPQDEWNTWKARARLDPRRETKGGGE